MGIDLQAIERLASDQSSLKAAAGLAKPAKWSATAASADGVLIWGECAGSGANPYRVTADLRDLGNKCTCPSRKFPCKHVLGLLWLKAQSIVPFETAETPDWVSEWLGRRRGGGAPRPSGPEATKDVLTAQADEPSLEDDPKAAARREAATARRAVDTEAAVLDALEALEQWIGDQLRLGLSAFIDDATARCRRVAARLVDGKAASLAGRVDELPSRLLALPTGDRTRGAVVELGKLVLLARAFRAAPRDPEIRRSVASSETREAVLNDPATTRLTATWEVLDARVRTRRDGLVSQTTWILNLGADGPRFAMLLDYFPASAGRRGSVFTPGERFDGTLVFYPARAPLRAVLVSRAGLAEAEDVPWPEAPGDLAAELAEASLREPWTIDIPVLLPAGRLRVDEAGGIWWRSGVGGAALAVTGEIPGAMLGVDLERAAAIWSGARLEILAARSPWGRLGGYG